MGKIEWTDKTWNPIIGCSHAGSPGCDHCYAERMAARGLCSAHERAVNEYGKWTGKPVFVQSALQKPYRFKEPRQIFVGSMTDLFHEHVKDEWLDQIFAVMELCPQHTFMLLTKRPERMRKYLTPTRWEYLPLQFPPENWPLQNVWLGVTIEDQPRADERVPILLETPAACRFVSVEPMLGKINLQHTGTNQKLNTLHGTNNNTLNWVICGGETGPKARPLLQSWARSIRNQCVNSEVPFFFKGWGEFAPDGYGKMKKVSKIVAGRVLDGRTWEERCM